MAQARLWTALVLYGGVLLGAVWLIVAFLARFHPGFVLHGPFEALKVNASVNGSYLRAGSYLFDTVSVQASGPVTSPWVSTSTKKPRSAGCARAEKWSARRWRASPRTRSSLCATSRTSFSRSSRYPAT